MKQIRNIQEKTKQGSSGRTADAVKGILKAFCIAAGVCIAPAAVFLPVAAADAAREHNDRCDYLLILGCEVLGADTPSVQLTERMERAAKYLNENKSTVAVPCGGCFRKGQERAEADIIAAYLIKSGVAPERILPETNSTTTFENFENAVKIIEKHSGKSVNELNIAFLTSDYHIFRASAIARACKIASPGKVGTYLYKCIGI